MALNNAELFYSEKMLKPLGAFQHVPHVVVVCGKLGCSNRYEKPKVGKILPEMMTKELERLGWYVETHNRARSRCPDCQREQERKRAGESPGTKVVQMLGKTIVLPEEIVPKEREEHVAIYRDSKVTTEPVREFRFSIRSQRKPGDLVNLLDGFGELMAMKIEAYVEGQPAKLPQRAVDAVIEVESRPKTSIYDTGVRPAAVAPPQPVVEQEKPAALGENPFGEDAPAQKQKKTMNLSPAQKENMRIKHVAAAAARRQLLLDNISEIYIGNTRITGQQMCDAMNARGLKPLGRGFPEGWTLTQLAAYLPAAGITLPGIGYDNLSWEKKKHFSPESFGSQHSAGDD